MSKLPFRLPDSWGTSKPQSLRESMPRPQLGRPYKLSEWWSLLPAWFRGTAIGLSGGLATAGLLIALMP